MTQGSGQQISGHLMPIISEYLSSSRQAPQWTNNSRGWNFLCQSQISPYVSRVESGSITNICSPYKGSHKKGSTARCYWVKMLENSVKMSRNFSQSTTFQNLNTFQSQEIPNQQKTLCTYDPTVVVCNHR